MRASINIAITFLFAFLPPACETADLTFHGPYYVRFTETSDFQKESSTDTVRIEMHLAGPAQPNDVIVSYDASGSARAGFDYEIISDPNKVTITAGDYFGYILVHLINNSNNILRSQDIVFTLKTLVGADLQIGQGTSAIGKNFTFTIFDDCILGGTYSETIESYEIDDRTVASPDCELYTAAEIYTIAEGSFWLLDIEFEDNNDNTLTIHEQHSDGLPQGEDRITGTGIVNPLTREISMTITFEDFENKPTSGFTLKPR